MQTLVELCCRTLAANYWRIDGLQGVPDFLGRRISWLILHQEGFFTQKSLSIYIKLFSESFGADFLRSFRFSSLLPDPLWITGLVSSCSLTTLCLDDCRLGLELLHLLPSLGFALRTLHFLSLRHNYLTNTAIRSLTAYSRYHGHTDGLKILDVSLNPFLDEKAVDLLCSMPSLILVYMSDTGASVSLSPVPIGWLYHRKHDLAKPRIVKPQGWLWEDYGVEHFEGGVTPPYEYESPLVIIRSR